MMVGLLLWLPARMATGRLLICFSNMVSNYNIVVFSSSLFTWTFVRFYKPCSVCATFDCSVCVCACVSAVMCM